METQDQFERGDTVDLGVLQEAVMNRSKYPLASTTWDQSELDALQRVISRNMYSMDQEVAGFEQVFSQFIGSRFAIMVNSGSSANLLAVAALFYKKDKPLKAGDTVVVPAVSWSTSYYPLSQYGLKIRFVDIDPKTLNYDLDQLDEAVDESVRMVLAVNLLGNPNDFERIQGICARYDAYLMEDNCESLGATYHGRQAGSFGIAGTYSSFFSHHISTMEGGVVTTDDEEMYHLMLSLRSHGWTRHLPKENLLCTKSDDPFQESFRFILPGYNLRPLEMSGAVGIEQMKKLPDFIRARRNNAKLFQKLFADHSLVDIQEEIGESSWFGFAMILKEDVGMDRAELLARMSAAGIEYRPIVAGNFARNPVMVHIDHEIHGDLGAADHIDANGFFTGNHHYPLDEQLDLLYQCLSIGTV